MSTVHTKAYLGGGCFWGMEQLVRDLPGVIDTEVGKAGSTSELGYAETVEITYDSSILAFREILDFFFRVHDPTTKNRQGNDVGTGYRSVVFYQGDDELKQAKEFISIVNESGRWNSEVVTALEPFDSFVAADEKHQDYLKKNPGGYTCHSVRFGSYLD